jgi:hypothetical protein
MLSPSRVERFVASGVVEETGDAVRLTEAARNALRQHRDAVEPLTDDEIVERVATVNRAVADSLATAPELDRDVAAEFLALDEFDLDDEEAVSLLVVLDRFGDDQPAEAGVPAAFTPVHGDRLVVLAALFPRAVVYVWRDDCEPCETVRADLDAVFPEPPEDVALLAAFGPRWATLLDDAYDVVGGPTMLFLRAGRPEARLVGPAPRESLENEVRLLRE